MADILIRRVPKVLADELIAAFRGVSDLEHELCFELLARYRRNSSKIQLACAAAFGIGPVDRGFSPSIDREHIPLEWIDPIRCLDEAFKKLHAYNAGGASAYVAEEVYRAAQKAAASRPRQRTSKIEDIDLGKELERRGYFSNPGREKEAQIVGAIALKADLHRSTVRYHIRKFLKARNR